VNYSIKTDRHNNSSTMLKHHQGGRRYRKDVLMQAMQHLPSHCKDDVRADNRSCGKNLKIIISTSLTEYTSTSNNYGPVLHNIVCMTYTTTRTTKVQKVYKMWEFKVPEDIKYRPARTPTQVWTLKISKTSLKRAPDVWEPSHLLCSMYAPYTAVYKLSTATQHV